jgi:hypothetical protein
VAYFCKAGWSTSERRLAFFPILAKYTERDRLRISSHDMRALPEQG